MGRLPGAWRAEREAQAGHLSASSPFDLLASLERLPPPPRGAVAGGLARGASSWPRAAGFGNVGTRRKLLSLLHGLAGLFPGPCLTGLVPACQRFGAGSSCEPPAPASASITLDHFSCFSVLFMPRPTGSFLLSPLAAMPRHAPGVLRTWGPQQVHCFLWFYGVKKPSFQAGSGHGLQAGPTAQVQRQEAGRASQSQVRIPALLPSSCVATGE